jgi:hypothetical protein
MTTENIQNYTRRAALGGAGVLTAALVGTMMRPDAAAAATAKGAAYGADVRKLGAVGDGQTDDSAAFIKAIDAARADGDYLVVVPPGTYRIAQTLNAIAPIRIVGLAGEAGSILTFDGTLDNGLVITQIAKNPAYPGPPIELSGLTINYGGAGAAVFLDEHAATGPFQDTQIVGCRFYVTGTGTGVSSLNQRSLVVSQCQFLGANKSTGISVNDSDNTTIVQNVFYHLACGIRGVRGAQRVYDAGCVVIGNSMSGISANLYFENWESIQVVGNMLDGGTTHCVHLVDCYRGSLSGNYLGPSGTGAGLLIETSSPNGGLGQLMFEGNYINHYGGTAGDATISLIGASASKPVDQVTISGNTINGYPDSGGIRMNNAQNVLIMGNTFNRANSSADGVVAVVDETPGANHIVHNIVDAAIDAGTDTITDNYQRVTV